MTNAVVKGSAGRMLRKASLFGLAAFMLSGHAQAEAPTADLIFNNGKVYTVDSDNKTVEAIAVKDGVITALGSDEELAGQIGPSTKVINLDGKMLMPGLIDGHLHPAGGGAFLNQCSLDYKAWTIDEILEKITVCLDEMENEPSDKWLFVVGWMRQATKPKGADLSASILDRLLTKRPVIVRSNSYHVLAANSAAMQAAGITNDTADPVDGEIIRDADGVATGIFHDGAIQFVMQAMPALSPEEQEKTDLVNMKTAINALNAQGVTSMMDAGISESAGAKPYAQLYDAGGLTIRPTISVFGNQEDADQPEKIISMITGIAEAYNRAGTAQKPGVLIDRMKMAVDGVIQAPTQTGALLEPYRHNVGTQDAPKWEPSDDKGPLYISEENLTGLLTALGKNGLNVHLHTTGDRSVRTALNAIEAARENISSDYFRPGLAHCEIVDPADFSRFAELDVLPVLSLQWTKPGPDTIDSVKDYVGPERFNNQGLSGKLYAAGARIAFGSDWPVEALNEWLAMQVALTRENPDKSNPDYHGRLGDDPGLDIETAIRAFTINAAYEINMEERIGSLEVGKYADMIVIDQDITKADPFDIAGTKVLMTVVGGREVYRDPSF